MATGKLYKLLMRTALSIAIILIIFFKLDPGKLIEILTRIDMTYILLAFLFSFLNLFLASKMWDLLLKGVGIELDFRTVLKVRLASGFITKATPSSIGVISRIFLLRRFDKKISVASILCTIYLEKIFSTIVKLTTVIFAFLVFSISNMINNLIAASISISITIYFVFLIFLLSIIKIDYFKFIPNSIKYRIKSMFTLERDENQNFTKLTKNILKDKKLLLNYFILSLISFIFIPSLNTFIIFESIGVDLPLSVYLFLLPITTSLIILPISIGGIGLVEGMGILILSVFGISIESSTLFFILNRFVTYICLGVGSLIMANTGKTKEECVKKG